MNRAIKFRGLRTDGRGWAHGFVVYGDLFGGDPLKAWIFSGGCWYEVIPETVGQFTGYLDNNAVEIYEGDILGVPERWYEVNSEIIKGNNSVYYESAMFKINNMSLCTYKRRDGFKVVGNIHEKGGER